MSRGNGSKGVCSVLAAVLFCGTNICFAMDEGAVQQPHSASAESALYMKAQLTKPLKVSKLKPGDVVAGKLARDVYSSDRELFSAGSDVRLVVDHLEKRRRAANDHWPGVVKLFTPRHENYPIFKTATIVGAEGDKSLPVSVVSISRKREVYAQAKKKKTGQTNDASGAVEVSKSGGIYGSGKLATPIVTLEAFYHEEPLASETGPSTDLAGIKALPVGTACRILLLGDVSASKSRVGDTVQARLLEPVLVNSHLVLPAGTLFEGKVIKRRPPRWGSRAGSLYLTFTGLTLPGGNLVPISASLTGAELDRRSHTKIDPEGELHGERPGKAWMAINIGVTAGLVKEVDDSTQLIIEAIVSTATDASTAGTARIVSSCISGIYMISRRGRDVMLPRFTEMNIAFDRPVSVREISGSRNLDTNTAASVVHGN